MRFFFIRLAKHDVNATAIRFPAGNTTGEIFIRVSNALVIILAVFVDVGVGIGITAEPELLNELFALIIRFQGLKGTALFIRNDVQHIFIHPFFVNTAQCFFSAGFFLFFAALVLFFLLFGVFVLCEDRERRSEQDQNQKLRNTSQS